MKTRTVTFDNWLSARNESCKMMELGWFRTGYKQGFVMFRQVGRNRMITILEVRT